MHPAGSATPLSALRPQRPSQDVKLATPGPGDASAGSSCVALPIHLNTMAYLSTEETRLLEAKSKEKDHFRRRSEERPEGGLGFQGAKRMEHYPGRMVASMNRCCRENRELRGEDTCCLSCPAFAPPKTD